MAGAAVALHLCSFPVKQGGKAGRKEAPDPLRGASGQCVSLAAELPRSCGWWEGGKDVPMPLSCQGSPARSLTLAAAFKVAWPLPPWHPLSCRAAAVTTRVQIMEAAMIDLLSAGHRRSREQPRPPGACAERQELIRRQPSLLVRLLFFLLQGGNGNHRRRRLSCAGGA